MSVGQVKSSLYAKSFFHFFGKFKFVQNKTVIMQEGFSKVIDFLMLRTFTAYDGDRYHD